jgi:hypothetical protein
MRAKAFAAACIVALACAGGGGQASAAEGAARDSIRPGCAGPVQKLIVRLACRVRLTPRRPGRIWRAASRRRRIHTRYCKIAAFPRYYSRLRVRSRP